MVIECQIHSTRCCFMSIVRIFLIASMLAAFPAAASGWHVYRNEAAGYALDIPPAYTLSTKAAQGSRIYHDPEGDILAVWSTRFAPGGFDEEVAARMKKVSSDGWNITYRRKTSDWASFSGLLRGQIRYVRAVRLCSERAAFFLIDYDSEKKQSYDPIVTRMVRSMKPISGC